MDTSKFSFVFLFVLYVHSHSCFTFLNTGSALEVVLHDYALYKSTFTLLYFTVAHVIISGFGIYGAAVVPDSGVGNT